MNQRDKQEIKNQLCWQAISERGGGLQWHIVIVISIYSGHPWNKTNILSNQVFTVDLTSALLWASLSLASLLPTGPQIVSLTSWELKRGMGLLSALRTADLEKTHFLSVLPTTVVTFPQLINFPFMGNPSTLDKQRLFLVDSEKLVFLSWEHSPTASGLFWIKLSQSRAVFIWHLHKVSLGILHLPTSCFLIALGKLIWFFLLIWLVTAGI